jgi:MHS family proline/betaine transporter-like MFS transporter
MTTGTWSDYDDALPSDEHGLQLTTTKNTNGGLEQNLTHSFNEDDGEDAVIRADHASSPHDEHMVTLKEDSWFKTCAGVAGNVLEWYDFAVFGYFSDILGVVFFPPHQDGHAAIIESFAVFGGAFFMRPIGGIMMGYIGDKYGSRKVRDIMI